VPLARGWIFGFVATWPIQVAVISATASAKRCIATAPDIAAEVIAELYAIATGPAAPAGLHL
jgi:hypothetical protein